MNVKIHRAHNLYILFCMLYLHAVTQIYDEHITPTPQLRMRCYYPCIITQHALHGYINTSKYNFLCFDYTQGASS